MSIKLSKDACKIGLQYSELKLKKAINEGKWISPFDETEKTIEDAVLDSYKCNGWKGYSGEGGLILNLIKAMSFKEMQHRHRSMYVEAIYAQNVAFEEDRFHSEYLLSNVANANIEQIAKNYRVMASKELIEVKDGCRTSINSTSMLDFFPALEEWMFTELFEAIGNELLHKIASKFIESPYEYRKGWPDLTLWKDGCMMLVEVKGPRDQLRKSQLKTITELILPICSNVELKSVIEDNA